MPTPGSIRLEVVALDLEPKWDTLQVVHGENVTQIREAGEILNFSQNSVHLRYESPCNVQTLKTDYFNTTRFQTDHSVTHQGFLLHYSTLAQGMHEHE